MPNPDLREPFRTLEGEIIDTLLGGHHEWRPDLEYPESYSDMQGAVRGLLRMFDVKRRPLALPVREMLSDPDQAPDAKCCECGADIVWSRMGGLMFPTYRVIDGEDKPICKECLRKHEMPVALINRSGEIM